MDRAIAVGAPDLLFMRTEPFNDVRMWMTIAILVPNRNQYVCRLVRRQKAFAR